MDQNSTNSLLIQKVYSEISLMDELELDCLIAENQQLNTEFSEILTVKNILNQYEASPNPTSVKLIMEESMRSSELEAH
ncbi:MAG: hypothetical protein KDC76_04080 [Bacteroidetes bacterium]|nr:hypothetical protein [Bacteroidota bacterium]